MNYSFTFDCGKAREKCVSELNERGKKISKIFGPGMIFFLLHNGKCVTNARWEKLLMGDRVNGNWIRKYWASVARHKVLWSKCAVSFDQRNAISIAPCWGKLEVV